MSVLFSGPSLSSVDGGTPPGGTPPFCNGELSPLLVHFNPSPPRSFLEPFGSIVAAVPLSRSSLSSPRSSSLRFGRLQRRFAWPLRKDGTEVRWRRRALLSPQRAALCVTRAIVDGSPSRSTRACAMRLVEDDVSNVFKVHQPCTCGFVSLLISHSLPNSLSLCARGHHE